MTWLKNGRDQSRPYAKFLLWLAVWAVWIGVLGFTLPFIQTPTDFFPLMPVYLVVLIGGVWVLWQKETKESSANDAPPPAKRFALVLAGMFATLTLVRDGVILWAFSYLYMYDSPSYIYTWADFTDLDKPNALKRSLPYPLMTALLDTANSPWRIIWVQVGLGALAVGCLVYVIARYNRGLAGIIGVLLVLDANWGIANRAILSESPYMSFHVLALALILHHAYQHKMGVGVINNTPTLLLAGLFYGWTVTLRPSGLFFAVPIVLAYFWFSWSWRPAVWVSTGIVIFLLASSVINLWRVDHFGISGRTGVFFGVPLFGYELFSPENGSASAELDHHLRGCYDDPQYAAVRNDYTYYILTYYRQCLNQVSNFDPDYESEIYTRAYREAILADPVRYTKILTHEAGGVLSFGVENNVILAGYLLRPSLTCRETFIEYPWCDELPTAFRISPFDKRVVNLTHTLIYVNQNYLLLLPPAARPSDFLVPTSPLMDEEAAPTPREFSGLVMMLFWGSFLVVVTRGLDRLLVLGSLAFIAYGVLSVVFGHVFVGRYAQPLSPFYAILSGVFMWVIFRQITWWINPTLTLPLNREGKFIPLFAKPEKIFIGITGLALVTFGYLFMASHDQNAYASIVTQAERTFKTLDSDMIYNPTPYFPDPMTAKWADPAFFKDDEVGEANQVFLYNWAENLQPQELRQAGLDYLVFDQVWWQNRTPEQQAIIQNPENYELLQAWVDETTEQQIWLYVIQG